MRSAISTPGQPQEFDLQHPWHLQKWGPANVLAPSVLLFQMGNTVVSIILRILRTQKDVSFLSKKGAPSVLYREI